MNDALIFLIVAIPSILVFWAYVFKWMVQDDERTRQWTTEMLWRSCVSPEDDKEENEHTP